jgi:hypothetical protein
MGNITGANFNSFKSAEFVYSKIKREFKSFSASNLIDDADFPAYTAEVLKKLGVSAYKEEAVILNIKNQSAKLPSDFKQLYAAYLCDHCDISFGGRHLQNRFVLENDITCEILGRKSSCEVHCECPDKIIEKITVRQYVNDDCAEYNYRSPRLLKLSPNVKPHCSEHCLNMMVSCPDEITINNGTILTNFKDGAIFLQYYAFPMGDDGTPMIPDNIYVEKAVEAYIKHQLFMNYWITGDVADSVQKSQYLQAEYEKAFAEAKYDSKLPAFSTMVNTIRNQRSMNKLSFFSQMDRNK